MSALANAPDFPPSLGDLQDHLPDWWLTRDQTSQLYKLLDAWSAAIDDLAPLWEDPYLDQCLTTATDNGLIHNFMYCWGLLQDQDAFLAEPSVLIAYIRALASNDESLLSLVGILTTLVSTPANTTGGPIVTFPEDGSGLTFPEDGSGITLYEFEPGNAPGMSVGLVFPTDGSGLVFPVYPQTIADDNTIAEDGTVPLGAGPGLVFASTQFLTATPDFVNSVLTIRVLNWLQFDRGQFARAVARLQDAGWYPSVIEEVPSL